MNLANGISHFSLCKILKKEALRYQTSELQEHKNDSEKILILDSSYVLKIPS